MSTLSKSTSPTLVKTLVKVVKPLDVNTLSWSFGHILQILSKHSKTYQCKSCVEFSGTHFIFRLAFQILRGKCSNLQVKLAFTVPQCNENQKVHQQFMLQPVLNTYVDLCENCRWMSPLHLLYWAVLKFFLKKCEFKAFKPGHFKLKQAPTP
jgi:hypothetical protein